MRVMDNGDMQAPPRECECDMVVPVKLKTGDNNAI